MALKIGDALPECSIPATSGLTFSPSSCLGKNVVLYFYPKDATPGCTVEAGNFRDTNEVLCNIFDVIKTKNMYGRQVQGIDRSTFLIDSKGILRNEWRGIKVAGHVEEVLKTVLALS